MNKETILVVDDNRPLADFVAHKILPSMGYKALTAHDGQSALKILQSTRPSLILLDLELPDTNGLELLRSIQKSGQMIPTILFTAHGSEQIAVDAFRLGVQDYLIKPADAKVLEEAIQRALTEARLREETVRLTNQLQEQVSWLNALSKVGQSITSTLELDEVLHRIIDSGSMLTQAEEGFLSLFDGQSNELYVRATNSADDQQGRSINLRVNDSLISQVIETKKPVRLSIATTHTPIKITTGLMVRSVMHVPILYRKEMLGVLSVYNRNSERSFTSKDEVMLISLADYAAVAIENASLYQKAQNEISERIRIEKSLRESEERYALAVEGANDGIWDWNLKNNKIYYSPRWKSMLGYAEADISDNPDDWLNRVHPQDIEKLKLALSSHIHGLSPHFESEYRIQHKDGAYIWMLSRGLAVRDSNGNATRLAGSQTDISDRKAAEAQLLHDALYDGLTRLPNRQLLLDRLKNAIQRTRRQKDYLFAVLFLDLDQFKNINDSLGHPVGNQLLIAIGKLLQSSLRATDTVARLGGDEFVILLEGLRNTADAISVSEWILRKLRQPIQLVDNEVVVSTSIGIVLSSHGYEQAEDMLRDADIAMYAAKSRGKATYALFDPSMREHILNRLTLETDLRQAIKNDQILSYYQPIIEIESGKIIAFEALARWDHPHRGIILPAEFIPIAKDSGLIAPIDRFMIQEACRQLRSWLTHAAIDQKMQVHVNVSSHVLAQSDLIDSVKGILDRAVLAPENLVIEISEDSLAEVSGSAAAAIKGLRELGCEVHIDDFGAGQSALMHLGKYPVTAIKIASPFIQQIGEQGENLEVVNTIVKFAGNLGLDTIAEGIEKQSQLDQLRAIGCKYGQGYWISKPLNAKEVAILLENMPSNKAPVA